MTVTSDVRTIRLVPSCRSGRPAVRYRQPTAELSTDMEHGTNAGYDGCAPASRKGERHLDLLKWGLLPYFTKDPVHAKRPINARAETVVTSGMFKSAFARRRCIVPADAFYEWKPVEGGKQPYAIARIDGQPMAFAGLWEGFKWPDATVTRTFTIITTYANEVVGELHDRMPVILEPKIGRHGWERSRAIPRRY